MRDIKNLKVKLNEIPQGGLELHYSTSSHELDCALFDLLGETPIYKVDLLLSHLDSVTQLKGSISATVTHSCSRCAEDFQSPLNKKFTTVYSKSEEGIKTLSDGLDDLQGSFDIEFITGNELDVGEVVHEQIAIDIPFQPLCSEDCKGLCPQCGANLNTEEPHAHSESEDKTDSPFAKLKVLRGE